MVKIPTGRKRKVRRVSSPKKKAVRKASKSTSAKQVSTDTPTPEVPVDDAGVYTPAPVKKKRGRPSTYTAEEKRQRKIDSVGVAQKAKYYSARDIYPLPLDLINWERREACKDLKTFCETHLPKTFYLGWSDDQLKCITKLTRVFTHEGKFSLAMPRGGGKTALCRAAILWGTLNAHKVFPFFIGSSQPKANQTLNYVKTVLFSSSSIQADYPEITWGIKRLENKAQGASGQHYQGRPTQPTWGSEEVRYPSLLFTEEDAEPYLKHDPDFLMWLDDLGGFMARSSGVIIRTAGIDGSIRGDADVHPLLLSQPRPDFVLLDDIQKDQKAESPTSVEKMIALVDGAIQGLSGPDKELAAAMPCTVIRQGDVSDTYLDITKRPEWNPERCKLVNSWPHGITDIDLDLDTVAGQHWHNYGEQRKASFRQFNDSRLANDYYLEHREEMDKGFVCSWKDRFSTKHEISAQQHAMNLRLDNPIMFPPEYQNVGRGLDGDNLLVLTASQLVEKTIAIGRGEMTPDEHHLVGMIDIQDEILFWLVLAVAPNLTGHIVDIGTYPQVKTRNFRKAMTSGWCLISREFFARYPEHRDKAIKTSNGKHKAPLEAKIYFALQQLCPYLLSKEFLKQDGHQTIRKLDKLAVDVRWGQASDVAKQYIRNEGRGKIMPYQGIAITPAHKQMEEYTRSTGWIFEDQINPLAKEVKWIIKVDQVGQPYLAVDVNRMKDFATARLSSPLGEQGSICLWEDNVENHAMLVSHLCDSEYPEATTARGLTKNMWQARGGVFDNDYWDCFVGALTLALVQGAHLGGTEVPRARTQRKKFSHAYKDKRS